MTIQQLQPYIENNLIILILVIIGISIIGYGITLFLINRIVKTLVKRSTTKIDDMIMKDMRPRSLGLVTPLLILLFSSTLFPDYKEVIRGISYFALIWVVSFALFSLINSLNRIYEHSSSYNGISIKGYLDFIKIAITIIGLVLTASLFSGESPLVILSGIGAASAVLMLIFKDTILNIVASIQIAANDLIKIGDALDVPDFGASGSIIDMSLYSIKIQNWDKTFTVIPTYAITQTPYKNWRGMEESGGRRLKRQVLLDLNSIHLLSSPELSTVLEDSLIGKNQSFMDGVAAAKPNQLAGSITNAELFRRYIKAYIESREDIYQEGFAQLVHPLEASDTGLPIEIYCFTKTIDLNVFEQIQAEIFDHVLGILPAFNLKLFQRVSGGDLQKSVG
ncbi:MAG: mechanosensitive ion channel [Anaerolineales bacterium]|nr:mechanosensitive ion channel [Anaerolineales bacterium]